MAVTTLLVCETTRQRLGDSGLGELAACLWPVVCQSCGRLLGDEPPTVVIDELNLVAMASLHHLSCRLPGWNDSLIVMVGSGQYTTFVARMVLLPLVATDGSTETCPLMLINPGLECVQLQRGRDGTWQVRNSDWLARGELARPGRPVRIGVPADGVIARATDTSVAVVHQVPPFTVYEAPADELLIDRVRTLGGVLVAVTPTLNPGDFAVSELHAALAHPSTLALWAGLHGAHRPRRRRFRLRKEVCVLHWSSEQISVGRLVGQAPGRLSAGRARAWAERVISPGEVGSLTWQPVREGRPDEAWRARGSPAHEHVLRRHPAGWNLVLVCGQAAGTRAETDNEAKAWAAETLQLQAGISGLTWMPGPSMPGMFTWYGIA